MSIVQMRAALTGIVVEVKKKAGDTVEGGEEIIIIESMKMEIPLLAENSGHLKEVMVQPGAMVTEGQVLVTIEV